MGYPSALVIEPPGPWGPRQTSTLRSACAGLRRSLLDRAPAEAVGAGDRCAVAAPDLLGVEAAAAPERWHRRLITTVAAGESSCPTSAAVLSSSRLEGALCHAARHGAWTKRKLQRSLNKNLRPKMATEQPQYLRNPVYVNGPGDQLSAIWCSTDRTSDHPDRERGTRCEGGPGPGVQPPLSGAH